MDLKFSKPQLELVLNKRAWSTWTPTVVSTGGTITSYTLVYAKYYLLGKITYIDVSITINTVGTASGRLEFTLPNTTSIALGACMGGGRAASSSGNQLDLRHSPVTTGRAAMTVYNSGSFSWTNGETGVVSGQYRIA